MFNILIRKRHAKRIELFFFESDQFDEVVSDVSNK